MGVNHSFCQAAYPAPLGVCHCGKPIADSIHKPIFPGDHSYKGMKLGDYVETIKGANFYGTIIAFDNDEKSPGCTVLAVHPDFAGTKHVYPLAQLKLSEKRPEQDSAGIAKGLEMAEAIAKAYDRAAFPGMEAAVNVTKTDIAYRIEKERRRFT